jgi:hypothetical protein
VRVLVDMVVGLVREGEARSSIRKSGREMGRMGQGDRGPSSCGPLASTELRRGGQLAL